MDMEPLQQLTEALADRYEIEREIGAGGMANVYLARDVRHQRRVALKVLKPELGAVLGVERFLAEIRVTANLQHPNLLPLFDSGEAGGLLYYVMPFVDGESLRARLDREKQLPIDEAVRLATAVAGALDYAHRQGVIHRDLKPENILLQEGQPLVTDFGIALAVSNAGGGRITQTGLSLGTPQYMSPEQATGDRSVDGRTDIYSLGAVLYEMLAGDPPYHASTSQAIIAKVITEQVPDVRIARPSVPENVAEAIHGALEKLPADRWSTAAQFSDALHGKALVRRTATARTMIATYTPLNRVRPLWIMLGLFVLGALAGALIWGQTHRTKSAPTLRFEVRLPATAVLAGAFGPTMALTPDGQSLIYVGRGKTTTALFRRRMSDLNPTLITGTDTAVVPVVSPDGRWVAFLSNTAVKKVPLEGGVSTPIVVTPRPEGFAWGRGDVIVLGSNSGRVGLQKVSARGGELQRLTTLDSAHGETSQRWPVALDDGKTILYTSWHGDLSTAKIGMASLETGESKTLDLAGTYAFEYVDGDVIFARADGAIVAVPVNLRRREVTGDPTILASGVLVGARGPAKAALTKSGTLIYTAGAAGSRLTIADSLGRMGTTVAESGALLLWNEPRFSPDGKRVAVATVGGGSSDIWVYDLANKTRLRLTPTDSVSETFPEWTPDGKRVMYRSSPGSGRPSSLIWQSADGSGPPEVLLQPAPKQGTPVGVFTPDGRGLVFRRAQSPTTASLWYRQLGGDTTSRLLLNVGTGGLAISISPNGHWLAYSSDESGAEEVYVTAFPTPGARWPISTGGGTEPLWSRDGKAIYYVTSLELTKATLSLDNGVSVLSRIPLFSAPLGLGRSSREYDLSPDGKHFLFSTPMDTTNTVIAVINWPKELKNKASARDNSNQ